MNWQNRIQKKITHKFNEIIENPLLTATLVLVIVAIVVIGLSLPYYLFHFHDFWMQILAEAHGMIFDIAVIGILLYKLRLNGEIRQRVRMYITEIEDFRLWRSDEAAFRIAGNIKRLNKHKINEINLVNCHLVKINLNDVNIKKSNLNSTNLSGSSLIRANLVKTRLNQTNFENANLNGANLVEATANGANFKDASLIKTNFKDAFLIKAQFKGAFLMEADFRNSFLMGADFEHASLYKADLRGAKGLSVDQLVKAKTLYLAKFDDDILNEIKINIPNLIGA